MAFARIYRAIWADPEFSMLSPISKLAILHVLTCQANRVGLFRYSPGQAADDTGAGGVMSALLPEAFQRMGWPCVPAARVVWVPSWWKWNPPANMDHLRGILADLADVPLTHLSRDFRDKTDTLPEPFRARFQSEVDRRDPRIQTLDPSTTVGDTVVGTVSQTLLTPCPTTNTNADTNYYAPTPSEASNSGQEPSLSGGFARPASARRARRVRSGQDLVVYSPGFLAFWDAIPPNPRKVAKRQAFEIWIQHGCEAFAEGTILPWVRAMAQTPQWREEGGRFVPAPLTMLRQARWEDGIPVQARASISTPNGTPEERRPNRVLTAEERIRMGLRP